MKGWGGEWDQGARCEMKNQHKVDITFKNNYNCLFYIMVICLGLQLIGSWYYRIGNFRRTLVALASHISCLSALGLVSLGFDHGLCLLKIQYF